MQQRDDVPAIILCGSRRERGIKIVRHGEKPADDIVRLEAVRLDEGAEQFVRGLKDLGGIVPADRGGAANSLQPH